MVFEDGACPGMHVYTSELPRCTHRFRFCVAVRPLERKGFPIFCTHVTPFCTHRNFDVNTFWPLEMNA